MRVLYIVTSAAPSHAGPVTDLVTGAQAAGWQVFVVSTPLGLRFLDQARLEQQTGERVRSEFRMPGEGKELPKADAVIAAPMTFNTINKWAAGITDNFAVGLLCELTGYGVPIVAVPMLKPALAQHLAFRTSLGVLSQMGVRLLFDPSAPYERRMPAWDDVLDELERATGGASA
ncbi:flavoprotein [Actinomadura sp. ATCC 31491]|uniref:Flavoprotein n=1 Tax=Actinomadura luzonensis TaxID=2805427 RepID=A0ABT0G4N4_9ACTN|nr:flavoprotein [Actinomadura luzonensis]MCK2219564.1 flavoprotein [Actinomadura luzonensis]